VCIDENNGKLVVQKLKLILQAYLFMLFVTLRASLQPMNFSRNLLSRVQIDLVTKSVVFILLSMSESPQGGGDYFPVELGREGRWG
jgi:hypothetical protein